MLHVSLIVEALRARPTLMFWIAALAQAALWTLVPTLFYAAPPGDVPLVLGIGREWVLGSVYGPPLAYWLAEIAFKAAGNSLVGVYALSQLCIVVTYWAVFALGRRIVGTAHAAMAVLLMTGISIFTVPTLDFGPGVLAIPLTALTLLFAYRALVDKRRSDWIALGLAFGLLLMTTYAGLILLALMTLFVFTSTLGRACLLTLGPWIATVLIVLVNFPHMIWLERAGIEPQAVLAAMPSMRVGETQLLAWADLLLRLAFAHAGLVVLLVVAGGALAGKGAPAPTFERQPVDLFAQGFVLSFALVPAIVATLIAVLLEQPAPIGGSGALVVLSGLAVVVAAGDTIRLYRQRIGALVWLGLLVVPPAMIAAATLTLPWTAAVDLEVSKPAAAMGQFFTDTFRRRTGKPLAIVVGDARTAGLVALTSPDRPSLYIDASPERAQWLNDDMVREKGAVLVWMAGDTGNAPPAALKERFPDLVPEVPRTFERAVQGRLALLRVGWAVIRPRGQAGEPPTQAQ